MNTRQGNAHQGPGYPGGPTPGPQARPSSGTLPAWIIGGFLVLSAIVGVTVFLLKGGGQPAASPMPSPSASVSATSAAPSPTSPAPTRSRTPTPSPTPSSSPEAIPSDLRPPDDPTVIDLPQTVGEWSLDARSEWGGFYRRTDDVVLLAMALEPSVGFDTWASTIADPVFSADGKQACGLDPVWPACVTETASGAIFHVGSSDPTITVEDVSSFAERFAHEVG